MYRTVLQRNIYYIVKYVYKGLVTNVECLVRLPGTYLYARPHSNNIIIIIIIIIRDKNNAIRPRCSDQNISNNIISRNSVKICIRTIFTELYNKGIPLVHNINMILSR